MNIRIFTGVILFGFSCAHSGQSANMNTVLDSSISALKQGHLVFQAGGYWSSQGKAQHIDINTLIGDDFTLTGKNGSNGLVGLGYFMDGQNLERVQLSYGLNFFYLPKTSVSGTIVQESLFTNLSYKYHLTHYPVYAAVNAKTKLPFSNLSLIADAGIGPNFMRTEGYSDHSLDGGITIPDNAFSGHTSTTFSATAGVGLQLGQVFGEMPLECGYRFFYLGKGRLAKNSDQIVHNLHTGTAYANAVLCAVRF